MNMTSRQRVLAALSHQPTDRVPLDLGSSTVTGIAIGAYESVRGLLNLEPRETAVYDRGSQLAVVDEDVLNAFGIDVRGIKAGTSDNAPDVEAEEGDGFTTEWGLLWSRSADADLYFVANEPLSGEISTGDILRYPWPDPDDPGRRRGLRKQALKIREQGDYAILLPLLTGFVQMSQLLRGFNDWYVDMAANPDLICTLMDQILEVEQGIAANLLDEVGDMVDVVMHFDDLGMQDRTIVSPRMYRQYIEPRMQMFYRFLHEHTQAKLVHHSDGAILPFMESFADMGIDALNPLQVTAKGMDDIRHLKEAFGSRISFWGGVDTQQVLPFGNPEQVQAHVHWLVDALNQQGGYVLGACHNIQYNVPAENIVTMFEAAKQRSQVAAPDKA